MSFFKRTKDADAGAQSEIMKYTKNPELFKDFE
jgi:hypothetical protein